MMQSGPEFFRENTVSALEDEKLQASLHMLEGGLQKRRADSVNKFPDFEISRDLGSKIKKDVVANLDTYLLQFELKVIANGGHVHWAADAEEANKIILKICKETKAKKVVKSKSMLSEEIGLNESLESNGIESIETDLGEYILQLRNEVPSHIVVPAFHLNKQDIADTFYSEHHDLDENRSLNEPAEIIGEARDMLRRDFLTADLGITGANFLVAETGSTVTVTNEGNADLVQSLPKTHVVVAGIEKIVPTLNDMSVMLRLLPRSATGQEATAYVTLATGPARQINLDGPSEYHVVLVDNGRSELIGTEKESALHCIRCGACMNHCPVYTSVGGHSYGWVYPGPIGAAIDPALLGLKEAKHLPNASTFCGRCEQVCPVKIPLRSIMRSWREDVVDSGLASGMERFLMRVWFAMVRNSTVYRIVTRVAIRVMRLFSGRNGRFSWLPMMGGWTSNKDFPAPEGKTFFELWDDK